MVLSSVITSLDPGYWSAELAAVPGRSWAPTRVLDLIC